LRIDASLVIHVVDDDEAVRESLEALLIVTGFDVRTYSSAEEYLAVSSAAVSNGCLLVDIHMPGMSGIELLQELASRNSQVPVLVLTASREDRVMEQALEFGAAAFLRKPISGGNLVEALLAARAKYEEAAAGRLA
jgi:two-component system response regulator FixJ